VGDDAEENLITLFWICHRRVHALNKTSSQVSGEDKVETLLSFYKIPA
jgi:hypothetical protein